MAEAMTAPFLMAAVVLAIAGIAKLRTPEPAARALVGAGLAGARRFVRGFAAVELTLGGWCAIAPARLNAALLATVYLALAALSLLLVRRRSTCGCFGESTAPASVAHTAISGALALVALVTTFWSAHGLGWIGDQPASAAAVLSLGIAASVYGTVLAYVELPRAWQAWGMR